MTLREALQMLVPLLAAYIGLLKTRTDLDILYAKQRAKETGKPESEVLRKRWYHRLKRKRSA